jgi:hypothetical protein
LLSKDGPVIFYDPEDGTGNKAVSKEEALACYQENREMLLFLQDWEKGVFTVSIGDFQRLPGTLMDYRRMYLRLSAEERK